jgi:CBS domain-containing protein
MTIAAILRTKGHDIAAVGPTATVNAVADMLSEWKIGAVLVRDSAGQLMGIVSERDIVRCLAKQGNACLEMTAAQLMTRLLHTVTPGTTEEEALAMMTAGRVRHLPVLEGGNLVGLISIGDVVKARLDAQAAEVDSLKAYVAGSV